jgi:hypothetical protein
LLKNETGGADRALRLGGIAEIEEELIEFPEFAAREEKPFLVPGRLRCAFADVQDRQQIPKNNGQINEVEAAESHALDEVMANEWRQKKREALVQEGLTCSIKLFEPIIPIQSRPVSEDSDSSDFVSSEQ